MSNPHAAMLQVLGVAASLAVRHSQAKQEQLEAGMRHLEQMAAVTRDQAQAALLKQIVSATTDLASRKVDLVFETYRRTQQMIQEHHSEVLAERRRLVQQRLDADENKDTRIMRRLSELKAELMELSQASAALGGNANRMAQQVGLGLRLPTLALPES